LIGEDKAGLLRNYLTKYLSKFSDSASNDWLNDDADANSIATTVLMRYHPMEPEMVLQLFGARFRQWHFTTQGGGKRDFIVPVPDADDAPEEVRWYQQSAWAAGRISLLDFLRKTGPNGRIARWVRQLHKKAGGEADSLEAFAAAVPCRGEKVVAAELVSRMNDRHYGQRLVLHTPFKNLRDFVDEDQLAKVPAEHRYLTMAILRGYGADIQVVAEELKVEGHSSKVAAGILSMIQTSRSLILDYLRGALHREPVQQPAQPEHRQAPAAYNQQQLRFRGLLDAALARCREHRDAAEERADELRSEALAEAKVLVCMGKPGTGKTTVCHDVIGELVENGGRVLFALPTAQLASRMRVRHGHAIDIDTCHAAFCLHDRDATDMPFLAHYDFIVVDEISQLSGLHSDRIIRLWEMADRLPALVLLGDRWQMAGMGEIRPWETPLWKKVTFKTDFHKGYRCEDPMFQMLLNKLRTAKPCGETLRQLQRRKAWAPPGPPTVRGVQRLLKAHPDTTILTCSRRGAQDVNDCAVAALFGHSNPVAELPGDLEVNPANYRDGVLKPVAELLPLPVPVYVGMQVYLTKNVRKDIDFVNGMQAVVKGFDARTGGLRVRTETGHTFDVWRYTDRDHGDLVYYPFRPGYASTILKFQGAELRHVTVYLDAPKVPGAAYTALSRVRRGDDFLIGGLVDELHFTPAA